MMSEKTCYRCKKKLPVSEMHSIGVWVCNDCVEKAKDKKKKS